MAAVTSLTVHRVRVPLLRPFTTAVRSATELETVLVELGDEDGRRGWGEAPVSRVTGATTAEVATAAEGSLSRMVIGRDVVGLPELAGQLSRSAELATARMAVDCALHDLAAQQAGLPLYRFLGGTSSSVTTDMTLSIDEPEALASAAAAHVVAGFRCIKVKLGALGDPVARAEAVREAVGPEVVLRVDANQAFSPEQAVDVIHAMEDAGLGLELVEQPVPAGDWGALAFVSSRVATPVMADESVWTLEDLRALIRFEAASMVNIKLAKTGGLHEAGKLVAEAREAGLGILIGCMLESTVGIGAAASLAAASDLDSRVPGSNGQDLDGGLWLTGPPITGGAQYSGNAIVVSDAPGLGIEALAGGVSG